MVLGTPSSWYELEVGCPLEKELLVASEEASFRLSWILETGVIHYFKDPTDVRKYLIYNISIIHEFQQNCKIEISILNIN